jgi:hypothetical protein
LREPTSRKRTGKFSEILDCLAPQRLFSARRRTKCSGRCFQASLAGLEEFVMSLRTQIGFGEKHRTILGYFQASLLGLKEQSAEEKGS